MRTINASIMIQKMGLTFLLRSLGLLTLVSLLLFPPIALADSKQAERTKIEATGIKLAEQTFGDDLGARRIIESYAETDEDRGRATVFTALVFYIELELGPKIAVDDKKKQQAVKEIKTLWEKHLALE